MAPSHKGRVYALTVDAGSQKGCKIEYPIKSHNTNNNNVSTGSSTLAAATDTTSTPIHKLYVRSADAKVVEIKTSELECHQQAKVFLRFDVIAGEFAS